MKETIKKLKIAKQRSGKTLSQQLLEIIKLRRGRGKIGVSEYLDFHLYNDALFSWKDKQAFVGWRQRAPHQELMNDNRWLAVATDKVLFQQVLSSLGLPAPKLLAIYDTHARYAGNSTRSFTKPNDFVDFIKNNLDTPVFLKPLIGFHGRNTFGFKSYEKSTDTFLLQNNELLTSDSLKSVVLESEKYGFILQRQLTNHPELQKRCGTALSTIRFWTLLTGDGPVPFRAIWRVSTGKNMCDNRRNGQTGNTSGPIDIKSGRVLRQYLNAGFYQQEVTHSVDTGAPIVNFELPFWSDIVNLALRATSSLPGLHIQAWDIAICSDGPHIIELSLPGDIDGLQSACRAGHWDSEFQAALDQLDDFKAKKDFVAL